MFLTRYATLTLLVIFLLGAVPTQAQARPLSMKPQVSSRVPNRGGKISRAFRKLVPLKIRRLKLVASLHNKIKGQKPDLLVLSDLHIGEGKVGPKREYSALEDFRVDKHFEKFTGYILKRQQRTGRKLELVLAGDTMDFLKIQTPPQGKQWPSDRKDRDTAPNEKIAVLKAQRIVQEHPRFFASLGKMLQAGHKVVLLPGNHDQELNFQGVQRVFRKAMQEHAPRAKSSQVKFNSWVHVLGKAMVEHGQRYDSINNLSNQLHPFISVDGDTRLRSAAGNYMVAHVVNPMKESIQGFDHMKPSLMSTLKVGWHLPKALSRMGHLAGQMADHGGPPTAADATVQKAGHNKALDQTFTREMARTMGKNLRVLGKGKVSRTELQARVREFDHLAAEPYMEQLDFKGGKLRRRLSLLKPSQLKRWTRYLTLNNTLEQGQDFAIKELGFDVHLSGHTHHGSVNRQDQGARSTYRVDTGTWTPHGAGKRVERGAVLTFAEVRQDKHNTGVRLRRWAPEKGYPVAFPGRPAAVEAK